MKSKKAFLPAAVGIILIFLLTACGDARTGANNTTPAPETTETGTAADMTETGADAYTKYADYEPTLAASSELIPGTNRNILVAYFSRSGNTDIPDGVDVVSSASLTVNMDGSTVGNAEQIAGWIAEETGGDLFLIQTEYTYPADYDQAVAVGEGQDIDGYRPKLVSHLEQVEQYDIVYLVYPIWHYTLSVPVRSFLDEYDLGGKTIYAFAANAGSRFADSIEKIQTAEPDANVIEGLDLSQREMDGAKDAVITRVKELMEQAPSADGTNEKEQTAMKMNVQIGAHTFTATLEDNDAVRELAEMMRQEPVTIAMDDYAGFEKVGALGRSLTTSNSQTTTTAGDIVLYNGNNIVMFYGSNSWSYTRIGRIDDLTGWKEALGSGSVTAVFTLAE